MSFISSISIIKASAAETYNKTSDNHVELSSGSKKSRLQFSLTNIEFAKKTADVYIEVIGDNFFDSMKAFFLSKMNHKFVKCKHNDNVVYINVNSLSKRLGIQKEIIYQRAGDENSLNETIHEHYTKYTETENKVNELFEEISEKHRENKTDITTNKIYKMCGIAVISFNKAETDVAHSLKDGSILFLQKQEGSVSPLLTLFTERVLGKGSYGRVEVVEELSKGITSVAKVAHHAESNQSITHEYEILSKIYDKEKIVGIQERPHSLFDFRLGRGKYYGYITPKYDCDLNEIMRTLKTQDRIECARQLLIGLATLEEKRICHGDIKPENCLFRRNKTSNSIECVIADFGDARDMSQSNRWPQAYTPGYLYTPDMHTHASFDNLYRKAPTKRKKANIRKQIQQLASRRDVYAMGEVINRLSPFGTSRRNSDQQTKINNLTAKMTCELWRDRISAKQALEEFNKIFPPP